LFEPNLSRTAGGIGSIECVVDHFLERQPAQAMDGGLENLGRRIAAFLAC
jgi:hypothetical protein